jgi:hypothetical protein
MNFVLTRYVLKAAGRDKLFLSMFLAVALAIALSIFTSSSAVTEKAQFSLVYIGGSLRLLAIAGLSLFVIFFVRRSFEARDVEYLLTRPISRISFILSHMIAFSLLALAVAAMVSFSVLLYAYRVDQINMGTFLWLAGIAGELFVMVNVSFFFAMVLTSPVTGTLATLGFYVLSRLMGQLLSIVGAGFTQFPGSEIMASVLKIISMFIPRFDLMAQTSWLLYGVQNALENYGFIVAQALLFTGMVMVATIIDFVKKQF